MEVIETREEDGSVFVDFALNKSEMSALIFAGAAEDKFDESALLIYSRDTAKGFVDVDMLIEASTENDMTIEDGFRYLQIGLQTVLMRGLREIIGVEIPEQEYHCADCNDVAKL